MTKREQIAKLIIAPNADHNSRSQQIEITWLSVSDRVRDEALRTADKIIALMSAGEPAETETKLQWRAISIAGTYLSQMIGDAYYQIKYNGNSGYQAVFYYNGQTFHLHGNIQFVTLEQAKHDCEEHCTKWQNRAK